MRNDFNAKRTMDKVKKAVDIAGKQSAQELERQAKTHRPWTDRTSNARNSIKGTAGWTGDTYSIVLSGNTEYFEHLELARAKQYSILNPTIRINAPRIIKNIERLIK